MHALSPFTFHDIHFKSTTSFCLFIFNIHYFAQFVNSYLPGLSEYKYVLTKVCTYGTMIKNIQKTVKKKMLGIGTVINSVSIIAGGLMGHFTGKLFKPEQSRTH